MASVPKLIQLPDQDTMPSLTLIEGIAAFAVNAESDADALDMAKAQNGNDPDVVWNQASSVDIVAASDMNGWSLRVQVVSPAGVTKIDETVTASGALTRVVLATGVLTSSENYAASDTVTIGAKTYTFVSPIGVTEGNVLRGVDEATSIANLAAAINHSAGAGTTYVAAAANPDVTAVAAAHTLTVTAVPTATAAASNAIATTAVMHAPGNGTWGHVTLTGGVDSTDKVSSLCSAMVAVLNARPDVNEAAFDNAGHVLTVTGVDDAFGDHKLYPEFYPPSENDPAEVVGVTVRTNLVGIPGFVVSKVDGGVAAAVLSVTTVADSYAIPKVYGTVGLTV